MSEYKLHKSICNYIKMQYPFVIFTSDASGIRLTIGNAKKMLALKANCKIPDLLILEPKGGFNGLILEIKKEGAKVYKKDGGLYSNPHLNAQQETLDRLTVKGYYADFVIGFDQAKYVIDSYMNNKF